ncbi:MAG: metallophosphoesterase [bacterium]|nr:metallophosphoesterase [bacterium]
MTDKTISAKGVVCRVVILLVAGLMLVWCNAEPVEPGAASALDAASRQVLYRGAFFLRLPMMLVARAALPSSPAPWMHAPCTAACMLAPFFWYGVWLVWRRIIRQMAVLGKADNEGMTRRTFLAAAATFVPPAACTGLAAHAVCWAPQRVRVARYRLPIRGLPPELAGLRVAHLSDTHYGSTMAMSYLERVVAETNALQPDLVVLTGDYVLSPHSAIEPGIRLFSALAPRIGSVGVLGNHDHWTDPGLCREIFADIGIPLIDNGQRFVTTARTLVDEPPDTGLCLGGVGDLWTDRVQFDQAVADTPDAMPRLILAHNPDTAEQAPSGTRIDLMLSGHTHGGQVRLPAVGTPVVPSRYGSKYAGGLVDGPQCRVLVSRGIGMAPMPVRHRVPPEIVLMGLVTADGGAEEA